MFKHSQMFLLTFLDILWRKMKHLLVVSKDWFNKIVFVGCKSGDVWTLDSSQGRPKGFKCTNWYRSSSRRWEQLHSWLLLSIASTTQWHKLCYFVGPFRGLYTQLAGRNWGSWDHGYRYVFWEEAGQGVLSFSWVWFVLFCLLCFGLFICLFDCLVV